MSADVNVLLTLANANAVSAVTGTTAATSASPLTPVQRDPSGMRMVADTPGIPSFTRARSSVAWSCADRADARSVDEPPGGGMEGDGDEGGPDAAPDGGGEEVDGRADAGADAAPAGADPLGT